MPVALAAPTATSITTTTRTAAATDRNVLTLKIPSGGMNSNKLHVHLPPGGMAGSTAAEGFGADSSGLLYKHVTPRRRQDQFGRDSTRHADYLLSMAVFPTGVRTPLLSDLQKKTDHQCGFEVIDKGSERGAAAGESGRHVHILDIGGKEQQAQCLNSRQGSATDSAKKPPPNTPLTGSLKLNAHHHQSQSFSIPPSSSRRCSPSHEKRRWGHSTEPTRSPNTSARDEKKVRDIRDPLYLNTYCPEERNLRYKKSTLPRLSSRARPWTVCVPKPSYRFIRNSQNAQSSEKQREREVKPAWTGRKGNNFRIDARDVMARANKGKSSAQADDVEDSEETRSTTGSQALLEVKSYFPEAVGDTVLADQRQALRGKQGCLHAKVKQCIKFVKYRERLSRCMSAERPLKAEHGRYRPFSTTTIRTPRTSAPSASFSHAVRHPDPISVEIYKEYIDTIALQTRLVSAADKRRKPRPAVSGVPRNNTAASSYQDSSVLQSVSDSNRPFSEAPSLAEKVSRASEGGHGLTHSAASQQPYAGDRSGGETDRGRGSGQDAGSCDPRGVHHALDIIRLSPKAQPPRSSRGAPRGRSRLEGEVEEGVRIEGKGEGENGREVGDDDKKTHAIFLPNVTKSATASVCSLADDAAPAAEA